MAGNYVTGSKFISYSRPNISIIYLIPPNNIQIDMFTSKGY